LTEDTEKRTINKEIRSDFHAEGNVVKGTTTEKATIQEPVPDKDDMPLPTDPRTIFLGGLFMLAVLVALYVAAEIIIPVVLAIVLKLILQPLVRVLEHVHVPRGAGAILAILLLLAVLGGTISALAAPATSWASKLPDAIPQVRDNLEFMKRPIASIQSVLHQVEGIAGNEPAGAPAGAAPVKGPNLLGTLLGGTASVTASFLTTLLVLFYLLVSGETFMRRLVEILPRFRDKRQAVELSMHVERDISAYLLTVTLINVVVGIATGVVMWLCGVANPALWGAVAFVLNFVPILGPMMGIIIFLMASVLALGVSWWAVLPVGLYLGIHVLEGEILTPMILARRFTINPVAVILSLIFWYWMWGVVGAILAVPMLAIIKIICDDLRPLRAIGHFLEG
jgi:predicted PurR-regulated permease PerM